MMADWVSFIVRDLDPKLLRQMKRDAARQRRSLSDLMRAILCEHYSLDCPPSRAPTRLEYVSRTQHLKMHPELWAQIKLDSEIKNVSMQRLVHETLAAHYQKEAVA